MPKRTNEFQQLVFLLQAQLGSGAKVTESKLLTDKTTGHEREVDIVVEDERHGTKVILGIECRGTKAKVHLPDVDQLIETHRNLTHKLIIVSKAGFTKRALKKAEMSLVETIQLADATDVDWRAYFENFRKLFLATLDCKLVSWSVDYAALGADNPPLSLNPDTEVITSTGTRFKSEYAVQSLLDDHRAGKVLMDQWYSIPLEKRPDRFESSLDFNPSPEQPWILCNEGKHLYIVLKVIAKVEVTAVMAAVNLSPKQFKQTRFLHGSVEMPAGKYANKRVHILVTEKDDRSAVGSVMFPAVGNEAAPAIHAWEIDEAPER
jgi:hypothetical protein